VTASGDKLLSDLTLTIKFAIKESAPVSSKLALLCSYNG
jgi:hypothetical protein